MKKVSADTITELTVSYSDGTGKSASPPTSQQLIEQIRADLTLRIESLKKSMQRSQESEPQKTVDTKKSAFKISHTKAVEELQKFEKIVGNVPKGFRLAPVLYNRIEQDQNARVYAQFGSYVRPEFMRYLANNHANELNTLGICQEGIERMKSGLDPVDTAGRLYDVNVDHIIERFGGGKASTTKEVDPEMPYGSKPTYIVNHFSNLILLPTKVHALKNMLNEMQDAAQTLRNQNKWVLMLVPEAGPGHSGYVAQPQSTSLESKNNMPSHRVTTLQTAETTGKQLKNILADVPQNVEQQKRQERLLRPMLKDMVGRLTTAFNDASKPRQDIKSFLKYYQGESFTALREKIQELPLNEAVELRKTMQWIDSRIDARFNKQAARKPANTRAPKRPKIAKPVIAVQEHVPHRKKQKKRGNKRR